MWQAKVTINPRRTRNERRGYKTESGLHEPSWGHSLRLRKNENVETGWAGGEGQPGELVLWSRISRASTYPLCSWRRSSPCLDSTWLLIRSDARNTSHMGGDALCVCIREKLRFVVFLSGRSGPVSTSFTFPVSRTSLAVYDISLMNWSPWKTHHPSNPFTASRSRAVRSRRVCYAPPIFYPRLKPAERLARSWSPKRDILSNFCNRVFLSRLPGCMAGARARHHYLEQLIRENKLLPQSSLFPQPHCLAPQTKVWNCPIYNWSRYIQRTTRTTTRQSFHAQSIAAISTSLSWSFIAKVTLHFVAFFRLGLVNCIELLYLSCKMNKVINRILLNNRNIKYFINFEFSFIIPYA